LSIDSRTEPTRLVVPGEFKVEAFGTEELGAKVPLGTGRVPVVRVLDWSGFCVERRGESGWVARWCAPLSFSFLMSFSFRLFFCFSLGAVGLGWVHAQDLSHRQSTVTVNVVNQANVPLPGATVKVEMLNHDFRFGSAVVFGELYAGNAEYSLTRVAPTRQRVRRSAMPWPSRRSTASAIFAYGAT
jgi:hypothetical protein